MNPILQLAEKIGDTTGGLCEVGPGPYGFGVHTSQSSDIGLVLSFDPGPVVNDTIFPEEIDRYEITVTGFWRADNKMAAPEEIAAYASSDQCDPATHTVANAILELAKEPVHATTDECHEAFVLMAKYEMNNKRGYRDTGPYVPADGAALRYSEFHFSRDGTPGGGGCREGHISLDDLLAEPFVADAFSSSLGLRELAIEVRHFTYGEGDIVRDVNEDELGLALRGAFDGLAKETSQQYTIRRGDVSLPPVSPLTERGMSLFFTAAAETAENMGFQVDGVVDGQLQISRDGEPVVMLYENGCGSHIYLHQDKPFFVLFPTGPYALSPLSVGQEGPLNDDIRTLLSAVKKARNDIPEVLHPNDYARAVQVERAAVEPEQGPTMTM